MRSVPVILFTFSFFVPVGSLHAQTGRSARLMDLPWTEAEHVLDSSTVVVIPMGAGSKEHGPHLPLACDLLQATWVTDQIVKTEKVVIAPEVNYGYYYYFTDFPGSTSVRFTVQRDMLVDICRRLSAFGPHRFYVINIGISTVPPLKAAAQQLAQEGILFHFTDLSGPRMHALEEKLCSQKEGTHADEVETSQMLYMHPEQVDMSKAVREYGTRTGPGMMVRNQNESGFLAPSGIYGDATLATKEKGEQFSNDLVAEVIADIDSLRKSTPPPIKPPNGLEAFTGTYMVSDTVPYHMVAERNALTFVYPNGLRAPLRDEGDDHFVGPFTDLRFVRNDARQITGLEAILHNGTEITARRVEQ